VAHRSRAQRRGRRGRRHRHPRLQPAASSPGWRSRNWRPSCTAFVPGRRVDDNAHVMLRFPAARAACSGSSQVAPGNENGLRCASTARRAGWNGRRRSRTGSGITPFGEPKRLITRGGAGAGRRPPASRASRRASRGLSRGLRQHLRRGRPRHPGAAHGRARRRASFPTVEDGLEGRRLRRCLRALLGRGGGLDGAPAVTGETAPVLELRGVSRRFGPVQVLFDVDSRSGPARSTR
jgi:hypothetical protein